MLQWQPIQQCQEAEHTISAPRIALEVLHQRTSTRDKKYRVCIYIIFRHNHLEYQWCTLWCWSFGTAYRKHSFLLQVHFSRCLSELLTVNVLRRYTPFWTTTETVGYKIRLVKDLNIFQMFLVYLWFSTLIYIRADTVYSTYSVHSVHLHCTMYICLQLVSRLAALSMQICTWLIKRLKKQKH